MIQFTIDGEAVPALRPRFSTLGGHIRAVDPLKSREYKSYVRTVASLHKPPEPLRGALELRVWVFRSIPKNFSKKKTEEAENRLLLPTSRPDTSNFVKLIEDACNEILWKDDSQIVRLDACKFYSKNPRVEVMVREI
jgi:Holliday junction resolvase RusA-like endonuclease